MTSPFPYFGGKRRAAHLVWERFGVVRNYVEPFAGSLAVLLSVPYDRGRVETANDSNGYLCNFWRAVQADPDGVASWADWPVSELDLHARHRWLVVGPGAEEFREAMRSDPDHYDVKRAGWWVWGACSWIGGGWCQWHHKRQLPHLHPFGVGLNRKLPHAGDAGMGLKRQLPYLSRPNRREYIQHTMQELSGRLRHVRVACGDWSRVTGQSVTVRNGLTGVLLDPPYGAEGQDATVYGIPTEVSPWQCGSGRFPTATTRYCA